MNMTNLFYEPAINYGSTDVGDFFRLFTCDRGLNKDTCLNFFFKKNQYYKLQLATWQKKHLRFFFTILQTEFDCITMFPWADFACLKHLRQQVRQWKDLVTQRQLPQHAHCTCNPVLNPCKNHCISNKQPFVTDKIQHQALILPDK